jgi:hypothetical protein
MNFMQYIIIRWLLKVGAVKELPIGRFKRWKVEVEEPLKNGLQQTNMFQVLWGNSLKAHPKGAAAKDGLDI